MKRVIISKSEGIQLLNKEFKKYINEEVGHKYLGISEADTFKKLEMKKKVRKKSSGNNVTAINSMAAAGISYSAGLMKWKKDELRTTDRKTRKIMTMHRELYPQAEVDRLYIPRKNGGRGMISVKNCVEMETESLMKYAEDSNEILLKAVEGEGF